MVNIGAIAQITARVCRTHHWTIPTGAPHPVHVDEPLTDEHIAGHLGGLGRRGACPMAPGESTTRLALLDFDSHKGETSWEDMIETATSVRSALQEQGLEPVPFVSSGGRGLHLFMLWNEPQDAFSVREALARALGKCGLSNGTAGVGLGQVEIFPKQNRVPVGGCGSMFVLPMAMSSVPLDPELWEEVDEPVWASSAPVIVCEAPTLERVTAVSTGDLERVRSALAAIPDEAIEDWDYDRFIKCAMGVHAAAAGSEEGLGILMEFASRSSKYDEADTERFYRGFKLERDALVTQRSIFSMAFEHGWVDPETGPQNFEALPPLVTELQASVPVVAGAELSVYSNFLTLQQFFDRPDPEWLIDGIIPEGGVGMIYGAPASGKSFLALDMICAIGRKSEGIDWIGKRTKQGRVLYIAAEGSGGVKRRVQAYCLKQGITLDELDIVILPLAPNFLNKEHVQDVIHGLGRMGPFAVVVVDTVAQVTPGANENASEDMGMLVHHCNEIARLTRAAVVLIHHAGKDASRGSRGWSGMIGAADFMIEVSRFEKNRVVKVVKVKDGDDSAEFGFELEVVEVAFDRYDAPIKSCYVSFGDAVPASQRQSGRGLVKRQREIVEAVEYMLDNGGELTVEGIRKRVGGEAWVVKRSCVTLAERGYFGFDGESIWGNRRQPLVIEGSELV
jgi:hypothetical protein